MRLSRKASSRSSSEGAPSYSLCNGDERGFPNSLSDELSTSQEALLLAELRQELGAELQATRPFPEVVGDIRLLRTLRAFDHCIEDAALAFRQHLAVREAWGLDEIRENVAKTWGDRLWDLNAAELPYGQEVVEYMPEVVLFARGAKGDLVSVGFWGRHVFAKLVQEVVNWRDKVMTYVLHLNEARAMLLDKESRLQGRVVHQVTIVDLDGWSPTGNLDRAWAAFATETAGPVLQTYHDFNSHFLAIRASTVARMVYGLVEPLLPLKVRQKIFIIGEDLQKSREMADLLEARTVEMLAQKIFHSGPHRADKGSITIARGGFFELPIEVPAGGKLRWSFTLKDVGCWQQLQCATGQADLTFSLARWCTTAARLTAFEWGPARISEAQSPRGCWSADQEASAVLVLLRWDNKHCHLRPKALEYWVEVEQPVPVVPPEASKATTRLWVLAVAAHLAALGIKVALEKL
mmetsp:Transcript_52088/g.124029  ORF Transcript_52088/g.124029 Transcript_52088/m.124029 type:complete len:464 (+) Transcript_52088:1-1392(+)